MIYVQQLLRRGALERRLSLCAAWFGRGRVPACPAPGAVSVPAAPGVDPKAYAAIGYPVFGTRALRADVAERVHRALASGEPAARLSSWMGCSAREAPRVAASLLG
ncbi:hypothetical protein BE21_16510 [Sorangium cellulosum]|uniref:Uncharacterized protein n=1 Tax=Sorangium cellulosum TaxID=56 RepID=A0A150TYK2_SORCE|nr:hypothetical protein BE21_16510 [Sorangium cellulosum]